MRNYMIIGLILCSALISSKAYAEMYDSGPVHGNPSHVHVEIPDVEQENPTYIGQVVGKDFEEQEIGGISFTDSVNASVFYETNNDNTLEFRFWNETRF